MATAPPITNGPKRRHIVRMRSPRSSSSTSRKMVSLDMYAEPAGKVARTIVMRLMECKPPEGLAVGFRHVVHRVVPRGRGLVVGGGTRRQPGAHGQYISRILAPVEGEPQTGALGDAFVEVVEQRRHLLRAPRLRRFAQQAQHALVMDV